MPAGLAQARFPPDALHQIPHIGAAWALAHESLHESANAAVHQSCASGLCAVRACTSHTWQVLLGCSGWGPCISKAFSALLSPFRLGLTAPERARMGRTGNVAASNPWQHRHVYLFACCVLWHPVAAHGYGTSFGHCELKGRDCGEWSCLCGWLVGCLCSLGMSRPGGHLVHGLRSVAGVGMGLGK